MNAILAGENDRIINVQVRKSFRKGAYNSRRMGNNFTAIHILMLVGAAQGTVLFALLFFLRRGNRAANKLLGAILLIISANIAVHAMSHESGQLNIPHHKILITVLFLLFGPLLYMYIQLLTSGRAVSLRKKVPHFYPFIVCLVLMLPMVVALPVRFDSDLVSEFVSVFLFVQVLFYMVSAIRQLTEHAQTVQNSYSSVDKINLHWLRLLVIGFTLIWVFALISDLNKQWNNSWDYACLLMSLFMYMIGYMGIARPEIFAEVIVKSTEETSGTAKKKYEKSTLSPEAADAYYEKLITFMACEKPFLNSSLSLPELACSLSMPVHHLSQVINERARLNFFDLVNKYRVDEAKRLLTIPEYRNITIISIGFDSGFNSVSAFNAAFKKHVHKTPSQYRNTFNS